MAKVKIRSPKQFAALAAVVVFVFLVSKLTGVPFPASEIDVEGSGAQATLKSATRERRTDPITVADHKLIEATVVRVKDGDTIVANAGGGDRTIRFIGVDTPEVYGKTEPYGEEASAYTKSRLVPDKTIWLEYDVGSTDRYGRDLCYVWLDEPSETADLEENLREHCFNAELLLKGYAQQMTIQPNSSYADYFTRFAKEARESKRGLWALPTYQ